MSDHPVLFFQRLNDQARLDLRHVFLEVDDAVRNFLVEKGHQPEMGARPLRRTVEQYLEDPMAEKVLLHPGEGRRVQASISGDEIVFTDLEVFPSKQSLKEASPAEVVS